MSEEVENDVIKEEIVTPKEDVKQASFADFIGSDEYKNHINGLKGTWTKEVQSKVKAEEAEKERTLEEKVELLLQQNEEKEKTLRKRDLLDALKATAKSHGADDDIASLYVRFGDEAETLMLEHIEKMNTKINSEIEKKVKGSFTQETPNATKGDGKKITIEETKGMSRDEIRALAKQGLIEGY